VLLLDDLIETLSALDTEQALTLAEMQPFPDRKAVAYGVIAQALLARNEAERAKALLAKAADIARKVKDPDRQASAWRNLATVMACLDAEQALNWARQIRDRDWRDWTFGDIAAVLAERDAETALEVAEQIHDLQERSSALADIAIAIGRTDFSRALSLARQIPDAFYQVQALCQLANLC